MSFQNIVRTAALLATSAILTSPAWAQAAGTACASWDKTAYDPAGTLHVEGFLVAQEGVAGVEAFSASARKWTLVSPPGSVVVGKGDWCMLIREPTGMTAYSARLNNSATLPFSGGALPFFVDCHDDVAVVVGIDNSGLLMAWGYSAVRGTWVAQPIGSAVTPADYVISRFVVGIRDANLYHGFSARTGAWTTLAGPVPLAPMKADGNTLMVDFTLPSGVLAGFTGVRGCWTVSPLLAPGTPILLDHNVLYGRVQAGPGTFRGCAYSAYSATWAVSPIARQLASFETISDNVVLLESPNFTAPLEGFGAGHASWNALPGTWRSLVLDEDYALAVHTPSLNLAGFSGLCGGPWVPEINPTGLFPVPVVPPDHIGAADTGNSLHVFRPGQNTWALAMPKTPFDTVLVADAVLELAQPGVNWAISTRWGNWLPTVPLSPVTAGTGSVIEHQNGAGVVDAYDERCDMWDLPHVLGAPSLMSPGRNLCVFTPPAASLTGAIEAYSVQRGDWTSPGTLVLPLVVGPISEENVAALADGSGLLWAYGSPNDGHVYYQWPNGTEYHVSPAAGLNPGCKKVLFSYGVRSTPGNFSFMLLGNNIACPPLVLPGYCGALWMPLIGTSLYATLGLHDPDCMLEFRIGLPYTLSGCIQPWFQPLTFDVSSGMLCFGCRRSDPAWIF